MENIPPKGSSVVFASNHCNTLMDAMVILQHQHAPTSFGARADIFKNPRVARVLNFLRIVPLARRNRDGAEATLKNVESFQSAALSMENDVPFVIFAEGTHRPKHSLMPLKKGVIRIAQQCLENSSRPVYIVPVGLDYDRFFTPAPHCTLRFGQPIPFAQDTDVPLAMDLLRQRISELITFFPDDENLDLADAAFAASLALTPRWYHYLLALLLLPLFVVCAALSLPFWGISQLVIRGMKDKCWANTVRFGVKLVLLPVLTIPVAILGFCFLKWYFAILLLLLFWNSPRIFYVILNFYKQL